MSKESTVEQILIVLSNMIEGKVNLIEGCRSVVKYLGQIDSNLARSEAATTIAAVESETDHYPVGNQRTLWNQASLAKMDKEQEDYLEITQNTLIDDCRIFQKELEAILEK